MIDLKSMPSVTATRQTITCECGWESTVVIPEEYFSLLTNVLEHLGRSHNVQIPVFTVKSKLT
jgi:hypothetical protein